jgi:SlyX protein
MDEDRLNELEIRLTHQEALIETLDSALIEQQKLIDQLRLEVTGIRQRLLAAGISDIAMQSEETRPPHY